VSNGDGIVQQHDASDLRLGIGDYFWRCESLLGDLNAERPSEPDSLGAGTGLAANVWCAYAVLVGEPVSHTRFRPSISIVR
jgi:hypothetical protein